MDHNIQDKTSHYYHPRNLKLGVITFNLCGPNVDLVDRIAQLPGVTVSLYPLMTVNCSSRPRIARIAEPPEPRRFLALESLGTKEVMCTSPAIRLCWRAFRDNDVVIALGLLGAAGLTIRILAEVFRKPVVIAIQQVGLLYERQRHWIIRQLKRIILSKRFRYIVQTPVTRQVLATCYGVPSNRMIDGVFSGIEHRWIKKLNELPKREQLREELGVKGSDAVVTLFVGSLIELKGIEDLIQAFAAMAVDQDELWIVGGIHKGREEYWLRLQNVATRVKGLVRFLGEVPYLSLPRIYRAADIFVLPSRKDTWPKVLLEAGMAGLPLITTDACGAAGYVVQAGRNGFVIPAGNTNALAAALSRLRKSRDLRERMGRESIEIAKLYQDCNRELSSFKQVIDELISTTGS